MFDFKSILKMLMPVIDKNLSDDKIVPAINDYMLQFPLENGELKNGFTITVEKDYKMYFSIVGIGYSKELKCFYFTKFKKQMPLIEAVKMLINKANEVQEKK